MGEQIDNRVNYLEGGYTPPVENIQTEGGSFRDYAVTSNIFGMSMYNPETNSNADTYSDRWDATSKMDVFNTLKTPQEYQLLNESVSPEHYELIKARNNISTEAEQRIANDNTIFRFGASMAIGALDPTILIPGTLAFKGSKALVSLSRVAYGGTVGSTASALQEGILSSTNAREANIGSAAFWGATIGGGLFAVGPMIAGGKYIKSSVVAKSYIEPNEIEKALSGELKDVKYEQGNDFVTFINDEGIPTKMNVGGVGLEPISLWKDGEVPEMNKFLQKFVISPTSRLARSKYPLFNRIGGMLQSSPIYRTMGGKLFTEGRNAWDVKQSLVSKKAQAIKEMSIGHIDAQKNGYEGNFDQYANDIYSTLDDYIEEHLTKAHEQLQEEIRISDMQKERDIELITSKYQESLNNITKRNIKVNTPLESRQKEMQRVKQQLEQDMSEEIKAYEERFLESNIDLRNNRYQIRLNEVLDDIEQKMNLDSVDAKLRKGVEGYQKYVEDYATTMKKLKMKGSENIHPKLYKTRSWNLDALASKTDKDIYRIIREAFVNDHLNKSLIKANRLRPSTIDSRVKDIVNHIREVELVRNMPDNTLTVPSEMPLGQYLEKRNFNLNDKYLEDLIDRHAVGSMEMYNYRMSGRVALQSMFGTDDLREIQRDVVLPAVKQARDMGATDKELSNLSDDFDTLFNQILGTHGLPQKPNAWGERATRMLMKLNYLTFGGGFGINAIADIGVVAFTNGLGNTLRHFGPALAAIRDMKAQAGKTPWVEQAIALGALSDYYAARTLSRFDDMDTMFTMGKAEHWLDKGGQVMQKGSGLEHITALEELMAIGGGTVDIVNTARKYDSTGKLPRGFEEKISRYGLTKEDLKWVASQPLKIHNNKLIDFNWGEWSDKHRMDKFQTAITKMMNDAVIRGDKTLLPHYMTSANPFMKLMTQFMRYPHIAYERILLRGASKPTARFLTGTMVSAATMASIYYIREQALIEAGVLKERDAKYAIFDKFGKLDEEALTRLAQVVLMKMPQFGHVPDIATKAAALTGRTLPGRTYKENAYTAIGGVSASRFEMLNKGLSAAFDGTFDSMDGYYMGKSITPFQNFLQLDQVYNPMIKDLIKGR